jgi:hypothetical protein
VSDLEPEPGLEPMPEPGVVAEAETLSRLSLQLKFGFLRLRLHNTGYLILFVMLLPYIPPGMSANHPANDIVDRGIALHKVRKPFDVLVLQNIEKCCMKGLCFGIYPLLIL